VVYLGNIKVIDMVLCVCVILNKYAKIVSNCVFNLQDWSY